MQDKRTIEEVVKGTKRTIKPNEVHQMRGNMFKLSRMSVGEKCKSCKRKYTDEDKGTHIGMVIFKPELKRTNAVICMDCIRYLEGKGVRNMEHDIKETQDKKAKLIKEYKELLIELEGREDTRKFAEIEKKSIEQIEEEITRTKWKLEKEKEKRKAIISVDPKKWDVLERYLQEQYNVIEDKDYLKHEVQIEEYFQDVYREFFECGQGYYQDEVDVIVHIANKFYKVSLSASIEGQKVDYGDKLYSIGDLEDIIYKEIPKPIRHEEFHTVTVSETDIERVLEILRGEGIKVYKE